MKKWITLFMSLMLIFSLTACTNNNNQQDNNNTAAEQTSGGGAAQDSSVTQGMDITQNSNTMQASDETQASSTAQPSTSVSTSVAAKKTLVVYYSATGSTERVAQFIADETGADTFELTPQQPYSSDDLRWTDQNSRVVREHNNTAARDVKLVSDTVANWNDYDTVFIGYPIWWGIAAWPVDNFIKANDFSNKTVIPFCTSSSSGLGDSGKLLKEMAGTGDWNEGIRFSSSASEDTVRTWVKDYVR